MKEPELYWHEGIVRPPLKWRDSRTIPDAVWLWDANVFPVVRVTFDRNTPQEDRDRVQQAVLDICNIRWGGAA